MNTKRLKQLLHMALAVALVVVIAQFLSINTALVRIGFAFLPVAIIAFLYGPISAGLVWGLGDFIRAMMFPMGIFHPGITVSSILSGVLLGLLLHKKRNPNTLNVTFAALSIGAISLFLTTFWIAQLTVWGNPEISLSAAYATSFASRIIQAGIMLPIHFVGMWAICAKKSPVSGQIESLV